MKFKMVSKIYLTHIVPAVTALVSLVCVLAIVFFALFEQWLYVALASTALVLDFWLYWILTKRIDRNFCIDNEPDKPTTLKD